MHAIVPRLTALQYSMAMSPGGSHAPGKNKLVGRILSAAEPAIPSRVPHFQYLAGLGLVCIPGIIVLS